MKLNGTHYHMIFSDHNNLRHIDLRTTSRETDVSFFDIKCQQKEIKFAFLVKWMQGKNHITKMSDIDPLKLWRSSNSLEEHNTIKIKLMKN